MWVRSNTIQIALALIGGVASAAPESEQVKELRERKAAVRSQVATSMPDEDARYLHSQEVEIDKKLTESIALLKRLISKTEGAQKADLVFRLAETYWEKSRYETFIISYRYEQTLKRYEELKAKGVKGLLMPSIDMKPAENFKKLAVRTYQQLMKAYPNYSATDRVLFFMSHILQDLRQEKAAEKGYVSLLNRFPNSRFKENALLALGEMYFKNDQIEISLAKFQELINLRPRSRFHNYAIYKAGWCYFNQQDYRQAVDSFKKVVEEEDRLNRQTPGRKIMLREEALNDLVLAFSEVGSISEAETYFKGIGQAKYFSRLLERLASIYFDQGKFDQSALAYRRLLKEDAFNPRAPEYQNRIVEAFRRLRKKEETDREMSRLVSIYNPKGQWRARNQSDTEAIQRADRIVETTLRLLATQFHNEARKTLRAETFQSAIENYRRYLEYFPTAENSYEMRFLFADLLFDRKLYKEAADQFEIVAKAKPEGKYRRDASLNNVLALQELIKREQPPRPDKNKDLKRTRISESELALVGACDRFVTYLPKDEKAPEIMLEAGLVYFDYNHFDEAITRLKRVVELFPTKEVAVRSARVVMGAFNWQKQYLELNTWARAVYRNKPLAIQKLAPPKDPKAPKYATFGDEVYEFIQQSAFKYALALESERKFRLAAQEFLKFEKEFPKSEFADKALFNAAVNFRKEERIKELKEVQDRMLAVYPTSPLTPQVVYMMGLYYEQNVDLLKAAESYDLLGRKYPKYEKSADALLAAAIYREANRQFEPAVQSLQAIVANFPNRKDVKEIRLHIGDLLEEQKKYREAINHYRDVIEAHGDHAATLLRAYRSIGVNYTRLQNSPKANFAFDMAREQFGALSARERTQDENRNNHAEVRFLSLDPLHREFIQNRPQGDVRRYGQSLERRISILSRLLKGYEAVVAEKSPPWAIRSLCRLGELYEQHSHDYLDAPAEGMTEDQEKLYRKELEAAAAPITKKADELYQTCLDRSRDLDFFSDEVAAAATYFDRRDPSRRVMRFVTPIDIDPLIEADFLYGRELKKK